MATTKGLAMKTRFLSHTGVILTTIVFLTILQLTLHADVYAQGCGTNFARGGAQGGTYASGGNAKYASGTASTSLTTGWNLISNPVANAMPGDSLLQLFPTSSFPHAFAFVPGSGYVQRYRAVNGLGYWAKFPSATFQEFFGDSLLRDSIAIVPGWNMIGSISLPMDTSALSTLPPGLRASLYYGYGGGYSVAAQILPGKGYWVKSSGTGMLVFAGASAAPAHAERGPLAERLNSITISDAAGGTQTLYFGPDAAIDLGAAAYEMPPFPPEGAFDARFEGAGDGVLVRMHAESPPGTIELPLTVRSSEYPLTLSWNVRVGSYDITDGLGGVAFAPKELRGEGTTTFTGGLNRLIVRALAGGQLPTEFSLLQNYPNPFNPMTTIRYALPVESDVTLKVFNVLGQEVATLIQEQEKAGYKSVNWIATGVSSGVYFYRLKAGGFVQTKRMLLLR
jgi:hypothetical protein